MTDEPNCLRLDNKMSATLSRRSFLLLCGSIAGIGIARGEAESAQAYAEARAIADDIVPSERVYVLPVFFVSSDQIGPAPDQAQKFMRHLEWARARYSELLRGVTFEIASSTRSNSANHSIQNVAPGANTGKGGRLEVPFTYKATHDLRYYQDQPESGAPTYVAELLSALGLTRYNCPYIFLIVVMDPDKDFPSGGGRPINGGYNTGGGVIILSSFVLDRVPNFQSTLQHELGHSFGLPHVDVYGYSMTDNNSLMSYNPNHHTNGFTPSRTPARLIPEDMRGLAYNQRALAGARFSIRRDVPPDYSIAPDPICLGPMQLPGGQPPWEIQVVSDSGAELGTSPANIVQRRIRPNLPGSGASPVTFDAGNMWHSKDIGASQWIHLTLTFPVAATLDQIRIYSQHSGQYHVAVAARMDVPATNNDGGGAADSADTWRSVMRDRTLATADSTVRFPQTTSRVWRLGLQSGESGAVVVRGLRFFILGSEVFPPAVPPPDSQTASG